MYILLLFSKGKNAEIKQNVIKMVTCSRREGRGEETGREARRLRMDLVVQFSL